MINRRQTLVGLGSLAGTVLLPGCGQATAPPDQPKQVHSEEDKALIHKFRGTAGFELYMSGFGSKDDNIRAIGVDDQGQRVVERSFREEVDTKEGSSSYPTGPYKYIDFKLYKGNTVKYHWDSNGNKTGMTGHLYGQWRMPVAERIPDDLLDNLRNSDDGGLRIKFRFHPDGVLLGWDIESRPGFDPNFRDATGRRMYVPPAYRFSGGDFKEARPADFVYENGQFLALPGSLPTPLSNKDAALLKKYDLKLVDGVILTTPPTPENHKRIWEKGWYIHPKTKQRIEIDF